MEIKKTDKRFVLGALSIMLAALFWSLDGTFIRPKFYELSAGLVVFLEHFFGFIVLSPFLFLAWQKIKKLSLKSWLAIGWVCLFGGAIGTLMITKAFFAAIDGQITFATVIILQKLQPVFALLLARLILGERLSRKFYFWAVLAVVAAYFLAFGKTGLNPSEINLFHSAAFFAFLAAFAFGSSTVFGKRIVNHLDFKSTAALRFGITSLMMLIFVLITGDFYKISQVSTLQWELLLLIVFTSGAAAMFIYYFGLKRISASVATIAELFWPFSAIALDYFFNKNFLTPTQIIATLILLLCFYKVVSQGRDRELVFKAKVIKGFGRGKKLGFPTANLDKTDLDLAHGVYLAKVSFDQREHNGLLFFGYKETFSEEPSLEVLIKDFSGDLYEKEPEIRVLNKIREVKKFSSLAELQEQIKKDLKTIG
jgi:drug/metabolite transporter (DMT)-like permease